jgi:hypothetical protein
MLFLFLLPCFPLLLLIPLSSRVLA